MLEKPLVSIIVPVYNVEKYLEKCLNSLICQTLKNIEIICVNDGSTDSSAEILDDYAKKDSRIIVINQKNQGLSIARNNGIDLAKGEYIGFLDSDDWVDLDFYEKLYNYAKENDCDITAAGIIRHTGVFKKYHLKISKSEITSDINKKFELLYVPDMNYVWNKIYKNSKIKEIDLKFVPNLIYEDVIFTPKVLYYTDKLGVVKGTYHHYRRNPNSLVAQRSEKAIRDSIYAHNLAQEFMLEKNIDLNILQTTTKRYKFLGLSVFKVKMKGNKKQYILFNIIKF